MSLIVDRFVKSFGDNIAVNELSFEITQPGVFGLIGTNGAGKTTAIRCILGIMTPDYGKSEWRGKPIEREKPVFGYMPEERGIYMKTKILEQLVYFASLKGMTVSAAKKSAEILMERLEVSEYRDTPAEKLSKGNQQKIQLIATLLHDPELIFLDEPFSGLDAVNVILLKNLIKDLVAQGKYIVLSSHQMNTVEEYCRDIVILNKGNTVLKGNLRSIKSEYGHTNLIVSCDKDVSAIAAECGLAEIEKNADETEYKINGDEMANGFLKKLLENGIFPLKFIIKEPSLSEIFIEKVGTK